MSYNPDNFKVTSGRDSSYRSSDVKGRPTSGTDGRKDFKQVLDKNSDGDEEGTTAREIIEENDGTVAALKEESGKKGGFGSLFDLTSGKKTVAFDEKPIHNTVVKPEEESVESPADLYGKLTVPEKKVDGDSRLDPHTKVDTRTESTDGIPVEDRDRFTTRFSTEQSDLSYVNPLAAVPNQQPSINLNVNVPKAVIPPSNIQEIINQMVEKVAEIKNTGTTETVVTLKHPPLFAGATIVVTAFDNAKNEFNISIENLTQAAKQMMDQESNKNNLLLALEQKGYAVHILSTTTLTETRVADALPTNQGDGRQQPEEEREGQGGGGKRGRENQA